LLTRQSPKTQKMELLQLLFLKILERETRFELATYTLARYRSTS
jgi:hypothetical protein